MEQDEFKKIFNTRLREELELDLELQNRTPKNDGKDVDDQESKVPSESE